MIFIDLDGVICNFLKAVVNLYRPGEDTFKFFAAAAKTYPTHHPWSQLEKHLGLTAEEFWQGIGEAGPEFWSEMEPYPWTEHLVNSIKDMRVNYAYLTSAPWGQAGINAAAGKQEWMHKHFGHKDQKKVIICASELKHLFAGDGNILIDDTPEIVNRWAANDGIGCLMPSIQWHLSNPTEAQIDQIINGIQEELEKTITMHIKVDLTDRQMKGRNTNG